MADVDAALAGMHSSINDLIAAAEKCQSTWHAPRAPGKWSPSQIVEHVARALDESSNVVAGTPSKFPTLPRIVRPLLRRVLFNRVLRTGKFPKGRTSKAFNPPRGPETPAQARVRLESAFVRFDEACRRRVAAGQKVDTSLFGKVSVEDYARFQELHTRHHCRQMPAAAM
jgi:hypothetical protein